MITVLGKVNCNTYNCELTIEERTFCIRTVDPKYQGRVFKEWEIALSEYDEYYIIEDVEDSAFMDPLINIVNLNTNKTEVRLAYYRGKTIRNEDEFVYLDREKINEIYDHIDHLNKESKGAIERNSKQLLNSVTDKVEGTPSSIKQLIYNFFIVYPPLFIYRDIHYLEAFEIMIHEHIDIGKNLNKEYSISDHYLKKKERLDVNGQENLREYYSFFTKLADVIKRKVGFGSDSEAIYYTWVLFNSEVCHYYYDQFNNSYGSHFHNIEPLSLSDCINIYLGIGTISTDSNDSICMFTFYMMYQQKFDANQNYINCYYKILSELAYKKKEKQTDDFEAILLNPSSINKVSINDVDLMGGHEFESFVKELFQKLGYKAKVTKSSGDQGIDILAEKNGEEYGIQTKCYSSSISNTAVQEVVGGLRFYNLKKGIVVTNSYLTESAKILAHSNDIFLWDRDMLKEKMNILN